jgi:hypothetical protein
MALEGRRGLGYDAPMYRLCIASLALSCACRPVDPAPADIDGLFRWYWNEHVDASDADVHEALDNAVAVTGLPSIEDALRGSISRLGVEDLEVIGGLEGVDPAAANGFYLVTTFDCTAAGLERIYAHLEQDELYVGVYDSYTRTYTSDAEAYFARETPFLDWDVELSSELLGTPYTEYLRGGLRWVPGAEGRGDTVIARTWMWQPSVFEGSNKVFDQDYQIEVFYEVEPGRLLHLYGLWRHVDMGGLTSDDDAVVNIVINNLIDWDEGTAELCAQGLPE